MAIPDLLANIGTALDRIERYIGGDRSINPANTLNGIRISLTTVREHMHRTALDAVNMQGLLNTANRRVNDLMTDIGNLRADFLLRQQTMDQAWRDERRARQHRDEEITDLRHMVCENVYEKCWWRRRYTACAQQAQNLKTHYQNHKADANWAEFWALNRYQKWKTRELNSRQIILNLQNNPPNMAANMVDVNTTTFCPSIL